MAEGYRLSNIAFKEMADNPPRDEKGELVPTRELLDQVERFVLESASEVVETWLPQDNEDVSKDEPQQETPAEAST
jgi:hypothetical protein